MTHPSESNPELDLLTLRMRLRAAALEVTELIQGRSLLALTPDHRVLDNAIDMLRAGAAALELDGEGMRFRERGPALADLLEGVGTNAEILARAGDIDLLAFIVDAAVERGQIPWALAQLAVTGGKTVALLLRVIDDGDKAIARADELLRSVRPAPGSGIESPVVARLRGMERDIKLRPEAATHFAAGIARLMGEAATLLEVLAPAPAVEAPWPVPDGVALTGAEEGFAAPRKLETDAVFKQRHHDAVASIGFRPGAELDDLRLPPALEATLMRSHGHEVDAGDWRSPAALEQREAEVDAQRKADDAELQRMLDEEAAQAAAVKP